MFKFSFGKIIWSIIFKKDWEKKIGDQNIINNWLQDIKKNDDSKFVEDDFRMALRILNIMKYEPNSKKMTLNNVVKEFMFLIPDTIKNKLIKCTKYLELNKTYHPRSKKQVLNLIHPSLYCCVGGKTKLNNKTLEKFDGCYNYQWIPSEFDCVDNKVKITSYINGLYFDPPTHNCISEIFGLFKPKFEDLLNTKLEKCQVIVKMANILLTYEKQKYNGGIWHLEGSSRDNIIATGIYYYSFDNVTQSDLQFRRSLNEPTFYKQSSDKDCYKKYGIRDEDILNEELGDIETCENKCIVFKNDVQHKVANFELKDINKNGYRKILVFFLIDPNVKILSTKDIPYQSIERMHYFLINFTSLGTILPEEVIAIIVSFYSTMNEHEAKKHQKELMKARSYEDRKINKKFFDRTFNLCEH